jgi:hypothetical protein
VHEIDHMTKKRLFSLVILYSLFILVFTISTNIALSIPLKNVFRLQKNNIGDLDNLPGDLNFKIDSFIENRDILYTVEFIGWAFIQSKQGDSNKEIKLIFVSGENRYEVETVLQERFDLRQVLQENNIPGYKHGFITKFSPIQMKNGIYKLFLYCYENDGTSGIVDTGRMYLKTYRGFSAYDDMAAGNQ